jgi:hypothetical protein
MPLVFKARIEVETLELTEQVKTVDEKGPGRRPAWPVLATPRYFRKSQKPLTGSGHRRRIKSETPLLHVTAQLCERPCK